MPATPETCPNCGADVPRGAKACPECGSCEQTGWSEEAGHADLGLPDDDFSYDDFVAREFPKAAGPPRGLSHFWWLAALIILALTLFWLFK